MAWTKDIKGNAVRLPDLFDAVVEVETGRRLMCSRVDSVNDAYSNPVHLFTLATDRTANLWVPCGDPFRVKVEESQFIAGAEYRVVGEV